MLHIICTTFPIWGAICTRAIGLALPTPANRPEPSYQFENSDCPNEFPPNSSVVKISIEMRRRDYLLPKTGRLIID